MTFIKVQIRSFIKIRQFIVSLSIQMHVPMYELQLGPQKVDICFYNCLTQAQSNIKCAMGFYLMRAMIVIWYVIVHFQMNITDDNSVYNLVTVLFFILVASNLATFAFTNSIYRNCLTDGKVISQIALRTQHSRPIQYDNIQDANSYYQPPQNIYLKVSSNVYQFANNLLLTDIDQQYKRRAQRNCSSLLSQQIEALNWNRFLNQLFNLSSIAVFAYSIVILSSGTGQNSSQFAFILTYLFTEVCTRVFIYLILFIIGLSPICCLGFCIYSCLFNKKQKIELPPAQQATLDSIRECQGQCPICFQNFVQKEQIVVLKCSPKHVFHQLCIKGWSKIGKTCPVCRASL